jgi:two-component system NtrC family sensor kinase
MALSRQRLSSFLKVLLVASVAIPAVLFGFFAWHSYKTAMQTAHERADRFASIIREHALKVFETISLTLENTDHRLEGISWEHIRTSRALWDQLRRVQENSAQVGSIFISPPDGGVALTTRVFPAPDTDFSDRDYFFSQRERDHGFYIGRPYIGKISKVPIFNFSIRRRSSTGQFDGIIGISAYVSYFEDYYRSTGLAGDDFEISLLREDGHVLVRYPSSIRPLKIPADSKLFTALHRADTGNFIAPSPIDGKERIVGYAKVRPYPVYALYGINKSAITSRWFSGVIPGGILALLAMLSLSSLCWFALKNAQQQQHALYALDDAVDRLQSEMKRREQAEASLMQAQRLEAVGHLTGGIAHDFNNLLTVISGNLDLAERRLDDPNALKRKFKSIRYAADRAKALTQQLLGFARRHTADAKTVDLKDALEKARTLIAFSLPERVSLGFKLCEEDCPVRIDVSEFEAAILNLVGNARDAMPNGGSLSISIGLSPASDSGGAQRVELRVKDSGEGMTPEVLHRVFEPFFTTKARGKGTGLGLSQVYGFVQQSEASIDIESEVGKGTCITISFAKSADPPVRVEPAQRSTAGQDDVLTILIVENQREVRQVSTAMLEDLGHQVLIARNSAEALALLHAGPIDLLFTDVALGDGLSGVELAVQAVASFSALRVLLTTGHPGRAELLGQNDFAVLAKPYTREGLASALQELGFTIRRRIGA